MKRLVLLSAIVFCFVVNAFAQTRTAGFDMRLAKKTFKDIRYSKITFIDSRYDTSYMGTAQWGTFNMISKIVFKIPFEQQLAKALQSLTDGQANDGELLFQLRNIVFTEVPGMFVSKGYCYIRASIYGNVKEGYKLLGKLDTLIVVKSMSVPTDVTFIALRKTLFNFIGTNAQKKDIDSNQYVQLNDIVNIDSVEKSKIILYETNHYENGFYSSYQTFKNQTPEKPVYVEMKNGNVVSVDTVDQDGVHKKVIEKNIYAFVDNGVPYISTVYGFAKLEKRGNDFFFNSKAKVFANGDEVLASRFLLGLVSPIFEMNQHANFEMKLDHLDGGYLRTKIINNTKNEGQEKDKNSDRQEVVKDM